ncbi:replicative DNA helicase [Kitasatospora sp. NPDC091276]|uniref:replicative DNA helicase n=1 Tax=unclassified Kitasatospora TaxID=2633591 RepID=UPI0034282695
MTGPQYDDHDAPPPEEDWQPAEDPFPAGAFDDASFPDGPGDRLPVSRSRTGQGGGREGNRDGGGREGGFQKGGKGSRSGSQRDGSQSGGGGWQRRDDEGQGGVDGFERVPPQDLAAEQSVLGGMLLSKDAIADVVEVLKPADYYRPAHEMVHGAILDLYARGEPADPITVAGELTKRGELQRVGGASYLHTLVNSVPTAANAEYYAQIVHERAVLRRLVEAGTRIAGMGYAAEGDVDEIVNAAQAEIYAVTEQRTNEDYAPLADIMEGALDEIEAIGSRNGQMSGVPTGFADFDALTNGLHPGQMIVIAARPAMGKSTLALDFARACSIQNKLPSVIFSLEMGRNEIAMRLLSAEARVALHHMRSGNMTDDDWTRVARRMPDVSEAPLFIDDSPNLSMMEIRAKCRRLKQRNDIKLVVIDYLQLMQSGGSRRAENRQQEVSDMSRNLKLLAKELEVPVIALSQLNRGPEQRTDKRPMVSDLRESGSIEQDADMVILLHREDAYEKESPRAGEADLIVAKHRNGPTATITVAFQGHYSRFVDMTRD